MAVLVTHCVLYSNPPQLKNVLFSVVGLHVWHEDRQHESQKLQKFHSGPYFALYYLAARSGQFSPMKLYL